MQVFVETALRVRGIEPLTFCSQNRHTTTVRHSDRCACARIPHQLNLGLGLGLGLILGLGLGDRWEETSKDEWVNQPKQPKQCTKHS